MFGSSHATPERTAKVRQIKEWARQALSLGDGVVVMVTELRCTEPGCPPLETVVAVMGEAGAHEARQFKIHRPLAEVVYEDVERAAAGVLRGETHGPHE